MLCVFTSENRLVTDQSTATTPRNYYLPEHLEKEALFKYMLFCVFTSENGLVADQLTETTPRIYCLILSTIMIDSVN
jgi:hypothetical protein